MSSPTTPRQGTSPRDPSPVAGSGYKAHIDSLAIVRQNALDAFEVWLDPKQHRAALERFLRKTETARDCDALIKAWKACALPEDKTFLRQRVFAFAEGEKRWPEKPDSVPGIDYVTGVRAAVSTFLKEGSHGAKNRPRA